MLGVGLEALIRVGAEGAEFERRKARLGLSHWSRRSFTRPWRRTTLELWLSHICATLRISNMPGDLAEDPKLGEEARHILVGQRVVERPVPGIEPDLHVGRGPDDHDERGGEHQKPVALTRDPESRTHPEDIREQTCQRSAVRVVGAPRWLWIVPPSNPFPRRPFSHDPTLPSRRTARRVASADLLQVVWIVKIAGGEHRRRAAEIRPRAWDASTHCSPR